ncbi:MAG: multifunctional CCA tRNA nucleotidyl transferase/2'3'-cyclic phosphodiesterase/2'nucleotidase/phosphatase [Betaproteobacteria bacterium]|nr:multifunctional CCA tRNA nucleotidyl transferase/2'3'-cyclic phosphodiesterase/2'nucleotidase/phosphatase [Betaproteobacteria bacterium]
MKTYAVGGAVRDELLGLPVQDRDWVVVGATPEDLTAQGFRPVGRDFPVFLHPVTHEEYALARTERKSGPGYKGFVVHASPDVTLDQDLQRRDLTINAMARDGDGRLIDPFGGAADLERRLLRHVSEAFAEDPVRILRVARFAARFKGRFGFRVAPETLLLMRRMVEAGEADALVPERVWTELARGLDEPTPSELFRILDECGALPRVLPEIAAIWQETGAQAAAAVDLAAARGHPGDVRFAAWAAALLGETPDGGRAALTQLGQRLRLPADVRDLALLAATLARPLALRRRCDPEGLLGLIERADGLRRPQRFEALLAACACREAARGMATETGEDPLLQALSAAAAVPAGAIAQAAPDLAEIPARLRAARLEAIRASARQ